MFGRKIKRAVPFSVQLVFVGIPAMECGFLKYKTFLDLSLHLQIDMSLLHCSHLMAYLFVQWVKNH